MAQPQTGPLREGALGLVQEAAAVVEEAANLLFRAKSDGLALQLKAVERRLDDIAASVRSEEGG